MNGLNLVESLFREFHFFSVSMFPDYDAPEDGRPDISFHGTRADGGKVRFVRATGPEIVLAALGMERTKRCLVCREPKRPDSYSKDKNSKDGRLKRCKVCERERVKAYTARRKARREAVRNAP